MARARGTFGTGRYGGTDVNLAIGGTFSPKWKVRQRQALVPLLGRRWGRTRERLGGRHAVRPISLAAGARVRPLSWAFHFTRSRVSQAAMARLAYEEM